MSSDQQCAFDNWQEQADEIIKQMQQKVQQVKIQQTQQKQVKPIVPKQIKKTLKQKIAQYQQITPEKFNSKIQNVQQKRKQLIIAPGKVLVNDKDFIQFSKLICDKFADLVNQQGQCLDDESITSFMQQLVMYIYGGLTWQNFHQIQKKLKVVKNARKQQEKKIQKQRQKKLKQKAKQQKKQQDDQEQVITSKYNQKVKQDDLFGGAVTFNAKQQQQQRKKKALLKAQQAKKEQQSAPAPAPAQQEQDDDDFM